VRFYLNFIKEKNEKQQKQAITKLEQQRDKFDAVYGKCADDSASFNAVAGTGKLEDVINKAAGVFA
jgi:CRISPR system Cascade subunit CasC